MLRRPGVVLRARVVLRRALCAHPSGASAGRAGASRSGTAAAAAALAVVGGGGYLLQQSLGGGRQSDRRDAASGWRPEEADAVPRARLRSRYNFKKSLGKGGFGEVWLAVDKSSGKPVAIKVLSLQHLPRGEIEKEIKAMRRCGKHPNVVALLDVVWVSPDGTNPHGEAALVMELAAGGGLFERLVEQGAYSEEYAAKILRQIAVALYHLHSRGIVHRDIKPENVVFESDDATDNHVKLIDFGTALALEEEGAKVRSGGRIGTWSYWAPEQLNNEPYDFAVDMWSLGVLLYILLVGFHPFDPNGDGTEKQILANMRQGTVSFDDEEWARVSPHAKSLVTALLCTDPKLRLTAPQVPMTSS